MTQQTIEVRSHVARDLLQSAAVFKNEQRVVWEYVSNGLQYVEAGTHPVVHVQIDPKRKQITIRDNGRGMDREGLCNFFVMHGENVDRKTGQSGRGRFGTGKSAAFGIADHLVVSSVRNGVRNTVELTREDIEQSSLDGVPVQNVETAVPVDTPNGTEITIRGIKLRRMDTTGVISFVERHLRHWRGRPTVIINSHECEFVEPAVSESRTVTPIGEFADHIGNVELQLKVSKGPLDRELQGVAISANGVWLQTTLAGAEGQPMSNFIFGEIDVPGLDDESAPIPAFDMSRSMELNPSNETVHYLLAFVGREVDKLRRELVKREKARHQEEETKRLDREAELIARMINEDFQDFSSRVARVKAKSGHGQDVGKSQELSGEDEDVLIAGDSLIARDELPFGDNGHGEGDSGNGGEIPDRKPVLQPDESGEQRGEPSGGEGKQRRPRGGFQVAFRAMGVDSPRATYASQERTIFVNLEHAQIAAALGSAGTDDPLFRRLAYEVAFSEYAIALASELANRDEYVDLLEPIFDIRQTLNRMAKRAASLYAVR